MEQNNSIQATRVQLGPIQNHSNHATHVACDIDKTAQPPVVERSLFFSRVLY